MQAKSKLRKCQSTEIALWPRVQIKRFTFNTFDIKQIRKPSICIVSEDKKSTYGLTMTDDTWATVHVFSMFYGTITEYTAPQS